jgi:hypothetical protein
MSDQQIILNALKDLHNTNRADIERIFQKLDKLQERVSQLPCISHAEKFRQFDEHVRGSRAYRMALLPITFGLIGTIVTGAMSFARLQMQVESHSAMQSMMLAEMKKCRP